MDLNNFTFSLRTRIEKLRNSTFASSNYLKYTLDKVLWKVGIIEKKFLWHFSRI